MLEIRSVESGVHRARLIEKFDPRLTTWVVSDLKAKLHLQRRLLKRFGALPEESVVRASELWRILFFRIFPEKKLLPMDLLVSLIRQKLNDCDLKWAKSAGAATQMFDFLSQMAGVLGHPQGHDHMGEWFRQNLASYMRWGEWYVEANRIWRELDKAGIVAAHWIPSILIHQEIPAGIWRRSLWVDLGPDLQAAEAEVFKTLSREVPILVHQPETAGISDFDLLLRPYEVFAFARSKAQSSSSESSAKIERRKWASQLSEVKDTAAQIRKWIDKGIPPQRIGVIAADIEVYGPILGAYLSKEGVPVDLALKQSLTEFPDILRWFSQMSLVAREVSTADLEVALFGSAEGFSLAYEQFVRLFKNIYSEQDLERHFSVSSRFKRSKDGVISRNIFLSWVIGLFPKGESTERMERVIKTVLGECPASFELSLTEWISYLEARTSRIEQGMSDGADGVKCVGLDSADDLDLEAAYFLGMDDASLRKSEIRRVETGETLSLRAQFGFVFPIPTVQRLEFKAHWVMRQVPELVLSYPSTDFSGSALAPSMLWLNHGDNSLASQAASPGLSRWDSLQRSTAQERGRELGWDQERTALFEQNLKIEFGLTPHPHFGGGGLRQISASSVQRYWNCPFVYCAEKVFQLSALPEMDLDPDHMSRGLLLHKVLELLLVDPFPDQWSETLVDDTLETSRQQLGLQLADESSWRVMKTGLIRELLPLLRDESAWRKSHPLVTTVGHEVPIDGHWDPKNLAFTCEPKGESIPFTGRIDRVDRDANGTLALLDYKSSSGDLKQFNSWSKSGDFQLAIYSAAMEKGLSRFGPAEVVAAYFYSVKDRKRRYGFTLKEQAESFADLGASSRSLVDRDTRDKMFGEILTEVQRFVEGARQGSFPAQPKDIKDCKECSWRGLCRAPHLS